MMDQTILKKLREGTVSLANTDKAIKIDDNLYKISSDYNCSSCTLPITKIGPVAAYEVIQCVHCGIDLKFCLWSKSDVDDVWKVTLTAIN